VVTPVQDGQKDHHRHPRSSYRTEAFHPQVTLGGVRGVDELCPGRLLLPPHDLAGLGTHRQLVDGAGQVSPGLLDLGLDLVR